ncbi:hypothetical protein MUU46_20990 [Scandinavium sp. TWS1a]|uniref:hypothetical protein n=1 Tax=Scandinavium tedordense TaxID=2926521 RepID=UPI002166823C|nr:hypothetical protein [Scandinavium tedordense]MCS2172766.1 hypothetical protein [Scandinavium tedordense]
MTKKFELVAELTKEFFGKKLFRIRALVSFGDVGEGEVGGWVEKEECLDQSGDAWVYGDAQVYGNARVYGNAWVYGNARVYGDAQVYGNAWVSGDARVYGDAQVYGNAWVYGNARVYGDAHWITVGPIGSENGFLTAFRQKDNSIIVRRGCFSGTIDEFERAVTEHHGDNDHGNIYLALIPVIKLRLAEVSE